MVCLVRGMRKRRYAYLTIATLMQQRERRLRRDPPPYTTASPSSEPALARQNGCS